MLNKGQREVMPLHVFVHHATMTIEAPTMTGQLPPTTAGNKSTGLLPPATSGFLRMRYTVGAMATLVDLVGSAVIFTVGASATGVSVEINVSYLDAAYVDVSFYPSLCFVKLSSLSFCF
jgi:hypothetical protein